MVLGFNSRQWLKGCFEALAKTDYGNWELFFLDNASEDGSVELVEKNFPRVKICPFKRNLGFAKAYNRVISRGLAEKVDYFVLVNPDVIVTKDWLKPLIACGQRNRRIGVLSPLQDDFEGQGVEQEYKNILAKSSFSVDLSKDKLKDYYPVDRVIGASMAVKAEAIKKIGLMDPFYFVYVEDTDWCRRARFFGFEVAVVPGSRVRHWHSKGHQNLCSLSQYFFIRNHLIYHLKNPFNPLWKNWLELNWHLRQMDGGLFYRFEKRSLKTVLQKFYFSFLAFSLLPLIAFKRRLERKGACYFEKEAAPCQVS
jgi:GT2 family glycosyltransferase